MALATQCPYCQTTFRVAHDQLKLRAGLVRCGSCKQIFNGIENLLRLDNDTDADAGPAHPTAGNGGGGETDIAALLNSSGAQTPAEAAAAAPAPSPTQAENPMLRMTLLDFAPLPQKPSASATPAEVPAHTTAAPASAADAASAARTEEDDPVEQAINDLQSKPWRPSADMHAEPEADPLDQADANDYEEPAFVRQARKRQRLDRVTHHTLTIGSAVLLLALLLQSAIAMRDQLAARFPAMRPPLVGACSLFGCQVGLPARIDTVSIESSELQAQSGDSNRFVLNVLLRNQGSTAEAWPYIELTLNDGQEKPLVRRVFVPRDYLPAGSDPAAGFPARSEQTVKVHFTLNQVQASGYRVYVFYP